MNDLGPVLAAAEEKLKLIRQLERETNELLEAPFESLRSCLERRQATLEGYLEADRRLKELCSGSEKLGAVIGLKCDFGSLPDELKPLLELSLSVRAAANRILRTEPEIAARLEREKAEILKNIESLNASSSAAANKYYRSFGTASGREAHENNKTS